jgi:hypothetical protein
VTTTCPFCGAAENPKFLPKRHTDDAIAYSCGAVSDGGRALWRSDECHTAEVARLTRERDEARAEITRLKAGGCARDQRTTQFCAEAVALQERVKRLEVAGDAMAADDATMADVVEAWEAAKEAKP